MREQSRHLPGQGDWAPGVRDGVRQENRTRSLDTDGVQRGSEEGMREASRAEKASSRRRIHARSMAGLVDEPAKIVLE